MYCENCGSAIPKGKEICEFCGKVISKKQSDIKKEIEERQEFKRLSTQFGVDNKIEFREDNKNIKGYILLSIILVVFLIIFLVIKLGG